MAEPTNQEDLRKPAADLNRDGIALYADLNVADGSPEPDLDELATTLRLYGFRGPSLRYHAVETEAEATKIIYDPSQHRDDSSAEAVWHSVRRRAMRDRVETRVQDWLHRLDALRHELDIWIAAEPALGAAIVDRPPVRMDEELMREYGIEPRTMPSFDVLSFGSRAIRFQPKGLWTLGANGRVDLITPRTAPILIDQSEPLRPPSRWTVYDQGDRTRGYPLDQDVFRRLVETGAPL